VWSRLLQRCFRLRDERRKAHQVSYGSTLVETRFEGSTIQPVVVCLTFRNLHSFNRTGLQEILGITLAAFLHACNPKSKTQ
jgi:hypothetical protein